MKNLQQIGNPIRIVISLTSSAGTQWMKEEITHAKEIVAIQHIAEALAALVLAEAERQRMSLDGEINCGVELNTVVCRADYENMQARSFALSRTPEKTVVALATLAAYQLDQYVGANLHIFGVKR